MDEALRTALSDGLSDGLDKQIIAGAKGLLTATNLANHDASALATFADYRGMVHGRVDGRYAGTARDVRVVMVPRRTLTRRASTGRTTPTIRRSIR